MLFMNLYEDILVRQKLKMKQGNSLINNIDIYISDNSETVYWY